MFILILLLQNYKVFFYRSTTIFLEIIKGFASKMLIIYFHMKKIYSNHISGGASKKFSVSSVTKNLCSFLTKNIENLSKS